MKNRSNMLRYMRRMMASMLCATWLLSIAYNQAQAFEAQRPIPRVLYTIYDPELENIPLVHRALEMPLNWLGYHLEFIGINDPLPDWRDDVAGAVIWMPSGVHMPNQSAYSRWLRNGRAEDKKLIFMGGTGFSPKWLDTPAGMAAANAILESIGMRFSGSWVQLTYNTKITHKDPSMVEFERSYQGTLPSYYSLRAADERTKVYLSVRDKNATGDTLNSDLVTTHPGGGYVSDGYGFYYYDEEEDPTALTQQRWIIHPFRFLATILGSDAHPKPDVTTLNGNRIYYSHMDGDGWNNLSELTAHNQKRKTAATILLEKIFLPYDTLPFTVAPIVAELDTNCHGLPGSRQTAIDIFALPNVEAASHTHSHPLYWEYFDALNPADEVRYLHKYPDPPHATSSIYDAIDHFTGSGNAAHNGWDKLKKEYKQSQKDDDTLSEDDKLIRQFYTTPRSYACQPFDMEREIQGSVDYLSELVPPDKSISLIQWSGNTRPSESALHAASSRQLLNINGGDSRYDPEYPSYSYVSPIGRKVGDERQIYSSNSNENTYTDLWSSRFFGFRYLLGTVKNTETPRRVSPFNVYFHSYSGEKKASLEALKQNLNYALSQDLTPVFASDYVRIANGYYNAEIIPMNNNEWAINNRGALQTLRFDRATLKSVDFSRSYGVIGQQHYQGSLYIFLNPTVSTPLVALRDTNTTDYPIQANVPYLIKTHAIIDDATHENNAFMLGLHGFGRGVMQIYWPYSKNVQMRLLRNGKLLQNKMLSANDNGIIRPFITLDGVAHYNLELHANDS